ncbi:MAG: DsrH/TusB family sulfur metabolism protein [Spirochaetota bacterium]
MKSILMMISSSPGSPNARTALELADNLRHKGNEVALYLLQDGVFHAVSGDKVMERMVAEKICCYCLEEDLVMRGFRKLNLIPQAKVSSYEELVDLMMEKYDSTIGIF